MRDTELLKYKTTIRDFVNRIGIFSHVVSKETLSNYNQILHKISQELRDDEIDYDFYDSAKQYIDMTNEELEHSNVLSIDWYKNFGMKTYLVESSEDQSTRALIINTEKGKKFADKLVKNNGGIFGDYTIKEIDRFEKGIVAEMLKD